MTKPAYREHRVTHTFHYGNVKHTRDMPFHEFLVELAEFIEELPGNKGRQDAIFRCNHELMTTGRGEFGWNTYTMNIGVL